MAMLAEPRRRQKWTLNPRGKHWSEDSNKFGQKMLEKMGWSNGKGLGANLDGMTEHIRARYKNDQAGIGFSHDDKDKQWTEHQEGYNELLQKLHNHETPETSSKDTELSGKSLELKSKQSRARVHYQKFTRGKDVNKYSTKDLANIFGKKDLNEKLEIPKVEIEPMEELEETTVAPIGTSDSSHGIVTIKGGSITDYFKTKMSSIGRKIIHDDPNDSGSETETHVGFGFTPTRIKTEPGLSSEVEKFSFENPALDITSPPEMIKKSEKRKIDYVFENAALELEDSPSEFERAPKRRKAEFAFVNGRVDLETPKNLPKIIKIEKIEFETFTDIVESSINLEETKKKRNKKSRVILPEIAGGFANEALSFETHENENSNFAQFEVARPNFGLANDALDLSDESSGKKRVTFNETVEYDIDGGSTRGKKKKKKSKNAAKLDKFEVDNGKLKKKKKKSKKPDVEIYESTFVNEAMDDVILSQEANENAINERKIERERRKRDRRRSNLETIAEAPEEEKEETSCVPEVVTLNDSIICESDELQVLSHGGPKEKGKKKRKSGNMEEVAWRRPEVEKKLKRESRSEENCIETIVIVEDTEEKKKKRKKKDLVEPEVGEERPEVKEKYLVGSEVERKGMPEVEENCFVKTKLAEEEKTPEVRRKKKKKHLVEPEVVEEEATPEVKKEKVFIEPEVTEEFKEMPEIKKEKAFVEPEVADEIEERPKMNKEKKKRIKEENVDKENFEGLPENLEIVESVKKRKKTKKEKKNSSEMEKNIDEASGEILTNENSELRDKSMEAEWDMEAANNHEEMQNGLRSPWDGKARTSKKIFKALFARSPVVNFVGSNINEIKGYGMHLN